MIEAKIDETNELIHKLIDEVFPSVYASFDVLDKRIRRLEEKMSGQEFDSLKEDVKQKRDDALEINDKLSGLSKDLKKQQDKELANSDETDINDEVHEAQHKEDEETKEVTNVFSDDVLSMRQQKKILNTLSCNYRINSIDDVTKFFDIQDLLFEITSAEYQKKHTQDLIYPDLQLEGDCIKNYLIDIFNFKYEHHVPDSFIIRYTKSKLDDLERENQLSEEVQYIFGNDYFNSVTGFINWDGLMLVIYRYKFENTKSYLSSCIDMLSERNQNISRPGSNFTNLTIVFELILSNLKNMKLNCSGAFILLSKIYNKFTVEVEYLKLFLPVFDLGKFQDICDIELYSQELEVMNFTLPDQWKDFLVTVISKLKDDGNEIKHIFLEDLKLYLQRKPIKVTITGEMGIKLNVYCIRFSKFWDVHQFENLFFLLYYNNNIDRILDLEKLKYYKYLKYELLEYLNFIPMILIFVIYEIFKTGGQDWDLDVLNDDLLIIASILITNLKFRNLLEACLFVVFNELDYEEYLKGKIEIESIMFKVMGDLIVENIDLVKQIIFNHFADLGMARPYTCLASLRNPFKQMIDKEKIERFK
ncbi:hypothetical protein CLIB1444_09S04346 [[Candida] jaroonii]|uniref:Uncharacterized protein n=1 Tax=[Candida] jaroonii TaxID=467808 RepID=A0ACA9YBN8_9ASCO|nr:hypothetical protein CLIB1444_09S04346 [[Candida] jaroonii]